jgi:hypothetical protein
MIEHDESGHEAVVLGDVDDEIATDLEHALELIERARDDLSDRGEHESAAEAMLATIGPDHVLDHHQMLAGSIRRICAGADDHLQDALGLVDEPQTDDLRDARQLLWSVCERLAGRPAVRRESVDQCMRCEAVVIGVGPCPGCGGRWFR